MSSRILVTGINGFVGQHLARELKDNGHFVVGVGREQELTPALDGVIHEYASCDLANKASIDQITSTLAKVDAVIHLAGIATTNNDPKTTDALMRINVDVHRLLYESLLSIGSTARVVAVSTGLVYAPTQNLPFNETSDILHDTTDTNPYIRSKLRVEDTAKEYRSKGLGIITVRPFNHSGPGQGPGFFIPDQINKIRHAKKLNQRLETGTMLDFWRDFCDVRDVVKAYRLLAIANKTDIQQDTYNVASGVSVYGGDIFRMIAAELRYTNFTDPPAAAVSESSRIAGNSDKLRADTGWVSKIPLVETIRDSIS